MIEQNNRLVTLLAIMSHKGDLFYWLSNGFGKLIERLRLNDEFKKGEIKLTLDNLRFWADGMELSLVVKQLDRIEQHVKGGEGSTGTILPMVEEADQRMSDCLDEYVFLSLSPSEMAFFEPKVHPFGDDVGNKFPSASFDVDGAGKCIALGLSTAAVFHLMRVMEIALRATNTCLGGNQNLVGNERNWGNIISNIRAEIENKTAKGTPEREEFDRIKELLVTTKDAWRNATMHVEVKYTVEEAKFIYECVKRFMKTIASRLDENGQPLA